VVVVSDFGNNDGLILGEAIDDWPERPLADWSSRLYLDDVLIGSGSVTDLVGGPFESLRFALEQTAKWAGPAAAPWCRRVRSPRTACTRAAFGRHNRRRNPSLA
jgi:hypothetical protein